MVDITNALSIKTFIVTILKSLKVINKDSLYMKF